MLSKKEILDSRLFNKFDEVDTKTFLSAMDEYAKQEAIGFANFIGDRPLPEYSKSTNQWRWWDNSKKDYDYATTEELYQQYLNYKK